MINKGIKIVNEAIVLDNEGKYQEALDKYQVAIEYLMTGNKCNLSLAPSLVADAAAVQTRRIRRPR